MKATLLAIPVRGTLLFPGQIKPMSVGRATSALAVQRHLDRGEPLLLAVQREPDHEDPLTAELSRIGVLARVLQVTHLPDGSLRVLMEGLERAAVTGPLVVQDGSTFATAQPIAAPREDAVKVGALARHVHELFQKWLAGEGLHTPEVEVVATDPSDPARLADQISGELELKFEHALPLLEEVSVQRRLDALINLLATSLAHQELVADVNQRVNNALDKQQREYQLKEQLKVIREELGTARGGEAEADAFVEKLKKSGIHPEGLEEAMREVERMRSMPTESAEYMIARTWLETVCEVPWAVATTDTTDLAHARTILDEDHYGLEKVKERLLEYLAVRQLKPDGRGAILCFAGPPGVGKTSLGRSIARALGRNFGRIALGGVKDETEVRGHRRTYIGALPGRLLRALIRAKSRNPVLVLDEIDKVGSDHRGDPASALLEVLDPEQNNAFVDHYLDISIDLSQVLFIATANLIDTIPHALRDRLEVLELPGYIEEDKVQIAEKHLLPRLADQHGLGPKQLSFTGKALTQTIRDYTSEAGVRDFERQLATIHRKVARRVVEGRDASVKVNDTSLRRYLGPPRYFQELAERVDQPGVVIGLAWTAAGGDILFIEATKMTGKRSLKLTGSLGEVMKESAEAAMSWLRSNAARYELPPEAFEHEFHLHVPAGAIPKDGPSAGVTMVTALGSVVTGRPVRPRLAMTGEITLRGKVLPVGGVKEKVLAARRAGVTDVILPRHNGNDLEDVPAPLRKELTFHLVDTVDEVLALALLPAETSA
jgi:ATP-dependent Lon protease